MKYWIYSTSGFSLTLAHLVNKNRDNSVDIDTGYGLGDRGSRDRFPAGVGNFSLHHPLQTGSGGQPSLLPNQYWGLFPWG